MVWSSRMNVKWDICTGLSEIHNHNEQLTVLLGAYVYTKLQTVTYITVRVD